jgi:hypothetical protein
MSAWEQASKTLLKHLKFSLKHVDLGNVREFCSFLFDTKRKNGALYLIGAGRSLDVLTIFGARLMQDPINLVVRPLSLSPKPRIQDSDAALICTGTGETASVLSMAENWLKINKNAALITSPTAEKYASQIFKVIPHPKILILLPGMTKKDIIRRRENPTEIHPPLNEHFKSGVLMPSPTKFELTSLLFLESVVTELYYHRLEAANAAKMP